MTSTKYLLLLGLGVLMTTQNFYSNIHDIIYPTSTLKNLKAKSYANKPTYVAYVYMTNHPESVDHYVSVHNKFGSKAKSTNYETRYNGQVCYNLTNYVVKDMGRIGNHQWIELIYGKDCVTGRIINEHIMTEEEPFSVSKVYWYNKYSDDPENPPTCTPVMYNYHVILTWSKDPDENVKQMIKNYVEEHNIKGLYRQDPSETRQTFE